MAIVVRTAVLFWVSLASIVYCARGFAADKIKLPLQLVAEAGERDRVDALVGFPVATSAIEGQSMRLIETTGGKEESANVQFDPQESRLWWVAEGEDASRQ